MTREPTEMEIRAARAGYEAMRNCGLQNLSVRAESPSVFLDASNPLHAFENQSRILQMDWVMAARAMIRAMGDPTVAMVDTGARALDNRDVTMSDEHYAITTWQAMIDGASPPEGAP